MIVGLKGFEVAEVIKELVKTVGGAALLFDTERAL